MTEFSMESPDAGSRRLEEPLPDEPLDEVDRDDGLPSSSPAGGSILRWTLPTCLLAWLVPGCGHLLVGRRGRALVLGLLIAALFFGGLALDGKVYRPIEGDPLSYLAAFGASGVGSLYMGVYAFGLGEGDVSAPYHEYGNTFTLVAGLLNLLMILDAFDFAVLRARASDPRRFGGGSAA